MKKDIDFPIIEGIQVVIAKETEDDWYAYLINKNTYSIENVLITTKGYGSFPEAQKTSTLRHSIKKLDKNSYAKIERIDKQVFGLYNEFWLSYYHEEKLYDKKFIFVPESITPQNCQMIEALGLEGVLHS
jgi:hypothetical protein